MIPTPLPGPSWADDRLAICGFSDRATFGPPAAAATRQVHGRDVHVLGASEQPPGEGDGLWTTAPGRAVAVRVADCTPILMWDPGVAAVAAVHAGWRGTALDIVGAAVAVGTTRLGVAPERLRVAIGPCIGPCCFEVGPEVVDGLLAAGLSRTDIGVRPGPRGRPHVDLRAANRALARRAGVPDAAIEDVGGCTHCTPGPRYESYRRDGTFSGRMRAIIALATIALAGAGVAGCTGDGDATADSTPSAAHVEIPAGIGAAEEALAAGDGEAAEPVLRTLVAAAPDDAHLHASLARALHLQGRYEEAAVEGRLALSIDPTLWQAAYNLACHAARLGDLEEALRRLQSAAASGRVDPATAGADPDLAALAGDHRFSFYVDTGMLALAEEEAGLRVVPPVVAAGAPVTVELVAVGLNRPLMGRREAVQLRLLGRLPPDVLAPVARTEGFATAEAGGRESVQRIFRFLVVPRRPGTVSLGPFEVRIGESVLSTETAVLRVVPDPEGVPPGPGFATPPARPGLWLDDVAPEVGFFRAPSTADEPLLAALAAAGGHPVEIDAVSAGEEGDTADTAAGESPWTRVGNRELRAIRFRALGLDGLPAAVPERDPTAQRTVLLQRGTEGWSHVIDARPIPAAATP